MTPTATRESQPQDRDVGGAVYLLAPVPVRKIYLRHSMWVVSLSMRWVFEDSFTSR